MRIDVHHHFPEGTSGPSIWEFLRRISVDFNKGQVQIMSRLSDIAAKVSADDATIIQDIEAVLAQNAAATQAAVATAVQAALDAHQVDDDAQSAILEAADTAITTEAAKLEALVNPPTPTPTPEPGA